MCRVRTSPVMEKALLKLLLFTYLIHLFSFLEIKLSRGPYSKYLSPDYMCSPSTSYLRFSDVFFPPLFLSFSPPFRSMQLTDDVDFHSIAKQTAGCSGADLRALLTNAQLKAVHETFADLHGLRGQKQTDSSNPSSGTAGENDDGMDMVVVQAAANSDHAALRRRLLPHLQHQHQNHQQHQQHQQLGGFDSAEGKGSGQGKVLRVTQQQLLQAVMELRPSISVQVSGRAKKIKESEEGDVIVYHFFLSKLFHRKNMFLCDLAVVLQILNHYHYFPPSNISSLFLSQERQRYKRLYAEFSGAGDKGVAASSSITGKQRVTSA
jgi:hypothetical protein